MTDHELMATVRSEGFATATRATAAGRRTNTDAFRGFVEGEWKVYSTNHPEAQQHKAAFMRGAGIKS